MNKNTRIASLTFFAIWTIISAIAVFNLKFSFSFDQFFPKGDEDLAFFQEFLEDFEADDNFMLIAVRRQDGVFEQQFLEQFHELTLQSRTLPHVNNTQSLTKFSYPIKTPFAVTTVPAIHIDQPDRYERDRAKILQDERLVYNLISEDATTLVIALETVADIGFDESAELLDAMHAMVASYDFEEYHFLGRAYFQKELVEMQQREVMMSTFVSATLVALIMFWIFRRPIGILIALTSIGLGLLLFMGLLSLLGRELNAMAALYPVLMVIVGTSDVIHIMSKYVDELKKGIDRRTAIRTTIREIGMATLLTSATTAIGFATLVTSKVGPIRDFGINAAIGVLVAYVTVIGFTTVLLYMCRADQIIKLGRGEAFWTT
ncbi:MAG: MMPL family transporter, partial [Bacteroidota bacterium]